MGEETVKLPKFLLKKDPNDEQREKYVKTGIVGMGLTFVLGIITGKLVKRL